MAVFRGLPSLTSNSIGSNTGQNLNLQTSGSTKWIIEDSSGDLYPQVSEILGRLATPLTRVISNDISSGSSAQLNLQIGASSVWSIDTSGHLIPSATNTRDIGSSGVAARSVFARNISSDTGQSLNLQFGGTTAWIVNTSGDLVSNGYKLRSSFVNSPISGNITIESDNFLILKSIFNDIYVDLNGVGNWRFAVTSGDLLPFPSTNQRNIGSSSLALASLFSRNISSDTGQSLNLQFGGTTAWTLNTSGHLVPSATNTRNIGSTSVAASSVFTRNISSDTGQSLNLQFGGTTAWTINTSGHLIGNTGDGISIGSNTAPTSLFDINGVGTQTGGNSYAGLASGYTLARFSLGLSNASWNSLNIENLNGNAMYMLLKRNGGVGGSLTIGTQDADGLVFRTSGVDRWTISSAGNITSSGYQHLRTSSGNSWAYFYGNYSYNADVRDRTWITNNFIPNTNASGGTIDNSLFYTAGIALATQQNVSAIEFYTSSSANTVPTLRWSINNSGNLIHLSGVAAVVGYQNNATLTGSFFGTGIPANGALCHLYPNLTDSGTAYLYGGGPILFGSSGTVRATLQSDGHFRPWNDNSFTCGTAGARWSAIWAANGTIQTSDAREKNTIQDSILGLTFINSLRPVSYKWNAGKNIVTVDENSEEMYDKGVVTPTPGSRTHWGLIAQEVKAAVDAAGVDFGGWVLSDSEDPNSTQALRYDQFIAPIIKAIQELAEKNQELEQRIAALEN